MPTIGRFKTGALLAGICLLLIGGASCMFSPAVRGSGVAKTETRTVGAFTGLNIEGSADAVIDVDPSKPQSVTISADDNLLPLLETTVKDGTLVLSGKQNYSSRAGVKLTITVASLNGAQINGSGNVIVRGVASKAFDAAISGAGVIDLSGTGDQLRASVSGSGTIRAANFVAMSATVSVAGSGNVSVNASKELSANIAGSGDVGYTGTPKVTQQISGSGSVHPN